MDTPHLSDVSHFEQLYLIGKVLGESMPLKFIISKCITEWNLNGEASIVDMVMALAWSNFANALDCDRALESQSWFVGGHNL